MIGWWGRGRAGVLALHEGICTGATRLHIRVGTGGDKLREVGFGDIVVLRSMLSYDVVTDGSP